MADPTPETSVEGQALLSSLGYNQELKRALSTLGNIALVLSDITPTASLLVIGTVVIASAGTGSVWAYLIGCFLAINVALCMGELGSMFPVAGGLFSIVTRVLGKPIGFLAMLDYMGQAVFLPASVAVGIGVYISALNGTIPSNVAAAVIMIIVTGIALFAINFNAILTGFFLALELAVVSALALSGLVHLQQPLSSITSPVITDGKGGLMGVGISAIIAAIAVAMFSVNGYDSAINFAEETEGEAKHVGRAVVVAAAIGIAFELGTFLLVFFGVPDLKKFLGSANADARRRPELLRRYLLYHRGDRRHHRHLQRLPGDHAPVRPHRLGGRPRPRLARGHQRLDRQGRLEARRPLGRDPDRRRARHHPVLPGQPGRRRHVHRGAADRPLRADLHLSTRQPGHAEGSAATLGRCRSGRSRRSSGLVGCVIALTQQKPGDLLTVAVIFAAGLIYYYGFIRPRGDRYWNMAVDPNVELRKLAPQGSAGTGVDPTRP